MNERYDRGKIVLYTFDCTGGGCSNRQKRSIHFPRVAEDTAPPLCRHGCFLANIMRSNSSAYGLPTSARHSRWPEPPHPEEQYPGRRCSRDYSCKRRMYFGCPRPGYVQNSQSRPKRTDYLINAGNRPILHVRAGKDTGCGSPDFVTDFRNTTGSSPRGGCCLL